jgi:hypothetical protein
MCYLIYANEINVYTKTSNIDSNIVLNNTSTVTGMFAKSKCIPTDKSILLKKLTDLLKN